MYSESIRRLRKERGITQMELAEAIGIARSTICMYETGLREPNFETCEAIADYFNCRLSDIIDDYDQSNGIFPFPKMNQVPILGEIACGTPIMAEQNVNGYATMPDNVKADFALICKGDSMINARIYDGDIVYIREQPDVENGEIAAVLIGNEATLKRVRKFDDHIVLEPENPMYRPLSYWSCDMNSVRILGKAVAFTSVII